MTNEYDDDLGSVLNLDHEDPVFKRKALDVLDEVGQRIDSTFEKASDRDAAILKAIAPGGEARRRIERLFDLAPALYAASTPAHRAEQARKAAAAAAANAERLAAPGKAIEARIDARTARLAAEDAERALDGAERTLKAYESRGPLYEESAFHQRDVVRQRREAVDEARARVAALAGGRAT